MAHDSRTGGRIPSPNSRVRATALRDIALDLAATGLPVFPVWHPVPLGPGLPDLICGCAKGPGCDRPGKHPANPSGFHAAMSAREQEWINVVWSKEPFNIGVAVGAAGKLVIDLDASVAVQKWHRSDFGAIDTMMVRTGRDGGGMHVYFNQPADALPFHSVSQSRVQRAHPDWPKTEIRGAGSYVIAPRSLHISGREYEALNPGVPIADMPPELLEWVRATGSAQAAPVARGASRIAGERRRGEFREIHDPAAVTYTALARLAHSMPGSRNSDAAAVALCLGDVAEQGGYPIELLRFWFFSAAEDCGLLADEREQTHELWCRLAGDDFPFEDIGSVYESEAA